MDVTEQTRIDPFTAEIIREALVAVAEEMFIATARTSKSPVIYEVLDYACGLTDDRAQLIAQANGIAGFLGTLTYAVRFVLDKYGPEQLRPGDIVVTNDPYNGGGTHLSDVTLVMPVFFEGELMAFAANKAHWTEIGGKDPGSWTGDATEVFQEGLFLPCIKLFDSETLNQALVEVIGANSRLPDMTLGDLWAQVASMRVAARRFQDLCAKYGRQAVREAITWLLDHGERMVRAEMAKLPQGTFEAEDWIDDDALGSDPIRVKVKVTITDDEFICDFTGTGGQVRGPMNCSWTCLWSGLRTIFKAITDPHLPVNEGCFRPIRAICPDGTIITCKHPAPLSSFWEPLDYVSDVVWKALAPVMPDRLPAGHFLSVCATIVANVHPQHHELTLLVEPQAGGWGALADRDGTSGLVCIGDGETYIMPVEITEAVYGIMVDQHAFNTEPGGEGTFRGGRGLVRDYRIVSDQTGYFTGIFTRHKHPAWGAAGGRPGSPNYVHILAADDGVKGRFGKLSRYPLQKGETARLVTGSGGGWGDPCKRQRDAVLADLRAGIITPRMAEEIYGVKA